MESSAAKQQPMAGGSMALRTNVFAHRKTKRRERFTRLCIRPRPMPLF